MTKLELIKGIAIILAFFIVLGIAGTVDLEETEMEVQYEDEAGQI